MANQDAPFGFRAVGGMGSSYETQGTSKYEIQDNYTGATYQGDLVFTGDGGSDANSTTSVAGYIAPSAVNEPITLVYSMAVSTTTQQLRNRHGRTITLGQLTLPKEK